MTGGRFAAWRAAVRIARRDAWRNKGRSALIAVMIGLPVLAVSAVSVVVRSTDQDPQDVVRVSVGEQAQARVVLSSPGQALEQSVDGSASAQFDGAGVRTGSSQAAPLPDDLDDADAWQRLIAGKVSPRDRLTPDTRIYAGAVRIGDRAVQASLRELDYAAGGLGGLVEPVSGRTPGKADEVVVTESLARHADVGAGDQLTLETGTRVRVVGVVGGIALVGDRQVIGRPGAFLAAAPGAGTDWGVEHAWLVSGPDPVSWDQILELNRLGATVMSRAVVADPPPSDRVPYEQYALDSGPSVTDVGVGAVIVGLFLLQIGLLAGPAIAVGARRSQRALAVVAASGGERRHLRSVVLAGSGVVGLVAAVVAAALGVVVGALSTLALRRYGDVQLVRVDVRLTDLLVLVAVGTLTAVAAAVVPAVQVAKLDAVAALTGRRPSTSPRRRVPVLGLIIAVLGGGIAIGGAALHQSLVAVAGIALCEVGLVMATGAVVSLVARLAGRLPIAPRFAMRDAARQRGRTAPAVAAVMAAIAGSTAALLFQASQDQAAERHYQASAGPGVVTAFAGSAEDPADVAGLTSALRRTLPVDDVVPLKYAATPAGQFVEVTARADGPCADAFPDGEPDLTMRQYVARNGGTCDSSSLILPPGPAGLVDDGTAAGVLTGASDPAVRAALAAGKAVVFDQGLLWPGGRARLTIPEEDPDGTIREGRTMEVAAVLSSQRPGMSGAVLPTSVVQRLGFKAVANGVAATTTRLPTEAEEERAQAIALGVGNGYVYVERGYESDLTVTMLVLLIAAGVITLGGTFTAVGLAAVESRPDLATFAAVGAGPALRRRISAGQAGVIAGLGTVLGVASGALVGWCLILLQQPVPLWIAGDWPVDSGLIGDPLFEVIVPVVPLVGVGVGMPLLAVAVGYVATRSRLPLVRRLAQ